MDPEAASPLQIQQQIDALEESYEAASGKANKRLRQDIRKQIAELRSTLTWEDIATIRSALVGVDQEEQQALQATEAAELEAESAASEVQAVQQEKAELQALIEAGTHEEHSESPAPGEEHQGAKPESVLASAKAEMIAARLEAISVKEEASRKAFALAEKRAAAEKQRAEVAGRLREAIEEQLPLQEQQERQAKRAAEEQERSQRRLEAMHQVQAAAKLRAEALPEQAPEWVLQAAKRQAVRTAADALSSGLDGGEQGSAYLPVPTLFKGKFEPEDLEELRTAFRLVDRDGNKSISAEEISGMLHAAGEPESAEEVARLVGAGDLDHDGEISWGEFLNLNLRLRRGRLAASQVLLAVMTGSHALEQRTTLVGVAERLSDQAVEAVLAAVGSLLAHDTVCAPYLPLSVESVATQLRDGVLLCRLVLAVDSSLIDERAITVQASTHSQQLGNLSLAVAGAHSIAALELHAAITARSLAHEATATAHCLGALLGLVQALALQPVTVAASPVLLAVLDPDEPLSALVGAAPLQLLMRWVNLRLKLAGSERVAQDWGPGFQDSEVLCTLLGLPAAQHSPEQLMAAYREAGLQFDSTLGGLGELLTPADLLSGRAPSLNVLACARLFRHQPGLDPPPDAVLAELTAALRARDALEQADNESASYCQWINGVLGSSVRELARELASGVLLLQLLQTVSPGCVDWKKGHKSPKGQFKCIENCCLAVAVGKQLGLKLLGIDGRDIFEGVPKLLHAFLDQLRRLQQGVMLAQLSGRTDGTKVDDSAVFEWASARVSQHRVRSFKKQPNGALGMFILELLTAVSPGCVDLASAADPTTPEGALANAQLCISGCWKLGCSVFVSPKDIIESKGRAVTMLVAAIWESSLRAEL